MTSAMPEQHRSPYWADDWTIGPVRVWPPARALLWCAGVDSTLLRTQAEALRYSGLGALVVAVAALGATTFSIFTAVVIGHFGWYLVPFGLAWGTFILLIDRAIVTEPDYRLNAARKALGALDLPAAHGVKGSSNGSSNGEASHGGAATPPLATGLGGSTALAVLPLPKDGAGWHVRGLVCAMRVVITLCIAYLVAEAAMLLIFHPEVRWSAGPSGGRARYPACRRACALR